MRNHIPQLPAGAQRITAESVDHGNGDRDAIALYQNADGKMTLLIDSLRDEDWDSVLLRPASVNALRKLLNRNHPRSKAEEEPY